MRFMLLTPGTGHFLCGSCLRDNTLGLALRELGHQVDVVPLYLPLVLEEDVAAGGDQSAPVRMGGINMYLQQKSRFASLLPRFVTDLLDRPGLLRWASRRGNLTDAHALGAMTLSMLSGEDGRQRAELDKLVAWASRSATRPATRPDVVVISNVLLAGIVRRLKAELGVPVIATLQGEAPFLDALAEPFAEQSWEVLRGRAQDIDAFVPVSTWYGDLMQARLELPANRVQVIHNGLDVGDFAAEPTPLRRRQPPTIGYLARLCWDKGVHTLIEAFVRLVERDSVADLRLGLAGVQLREDRAVLDSLLAPLRAKGLRERVSVHPNVSRAEKLRLLQTFSVFSVPATYGESFGLYLLEAMAAGVPVVQPRHAAFPELLASTGGGVLCEPDDPADLAVELERLLLDQDRSQDLATTGRDAVLTRFPAERMAREFAALGNMLSQTRTRSH